MEPSVRTVLEETIVAGYNVLRLIHRSAGVNPAGAGSRKDGEAWGAISTDRVSGCTHGQWFKTEAEARARYELVKEQNPIADK